MPSRSLQERFTRINAGRTVLGDGEDLISTPTSSGYRMAFGTGTLVSGTATIATGLDTVVSFTANVNRTTSPATGAGEVSNIWIGTITTGSVVVTGAFNAFVTGAATVSASGTATFNWLAFGT